MSDLHRSTDCQEVSGALVAFSGELQWSGDAQVPNPGLPQERSGSRFLPAPPCLRGGTFGGPAKGEKVFSLSGQRR